MIEAKKKTMIEDINYSLLKQLIEKQMETFELKELIGYGSESHVYKSIIKKINKPVTMKIIYNKKKRNKNLKEIEIANKLRNKNVINFFGLKNLKSENCDVDCIIMEYSKFGNLRQFQRNFIKSYYMSESTLCYFSYLILKGLKYCHMSKIAHLDIKPQNIIIDDTLNLKLIDFSISIDYRDIDKTIKLPYRGTKYYMAPEIINSEVIDVNDLEKVDLFSLGVMLYNFAFCSYPYESTEESNDEQIEEKMNIFVDENKLQYSKYFIHFLKKLLEKDIKKRINIRQAMEDYWINGAKILIEEKEKLNNANIFLSYLMFDYFHSFNQYIL